MVKLSPAREKVPLIRGLKLFSRGKVRDTYELRGDRLLIGASNGTSIFDFVLNVLIPQKGQVLTAMSHFWFQLLEQHGIKSHFLAAGAEIDQFLPEKLRGNPDLQSRAMVVKRLKMIDVEFIGRGFLTGSVLREYLDTSSIYGYSLPSGLQDGDQLPFILDTPTTKETKDHDKPLDAFEIRRQYPEETYLLIKIFQIISFYARKQGIIFADTKFEFGLDSNGILQLGDEVGTPDSSRWWDERAWQESREPEEGRKAPPPLDKQLLRNWGLGKGINELDPNNPAHLRKVHRFRIPQALIQATTQTYRYILWRLTDEILESYFEKHLGVELEPPQKKVVLIFGSESNITPEINANIKVFQNPSSQKQIAELVVHVISCHRNPDPLSQFVQNSCEGADIIVATGSKALALPGVLDTLIHHSGQNIPVVGVALGGKGTRAFEAACLSIEELPGQPVIMDELTGQVYTGEKGLWDALNRINSGELPPPKPRKEKPARFNIDPAQFVIQS